MNAAKIRAAASEARRFLAKVREWEQAQGTEVINGHKFPYPTPKESGAVRRSSMDLTRALAEMRRPS